MTFSCKKIGSPAIIHRWQTYMKNTRINQTESCPPSGYSPYLLSSGVADKCDRGNYWSGALVLVSGVGGRGRPLFFSFFTGLFLFPPAVGGCHWSMGRKTERETWRVTLKLPSIPDGLSLLPSTVRPREACWEHTSPLTLHTLECLHGHVDSLAAVLFTPNNLKSFHSEQTLDRRLQQKLSLDEIRSSMQQRQVTTRMEYAAGSQCNYL